MPVVVRSGCLFGCLLAKVCFPHSHTPPSSILTRNHHVVSDQSQGSALCLKDGITAPATDRLGDTISPTLTNASHHSHHVKQPTSRPPWIQSCYHSWRRVKRPPQFYSISQDDIIVAVMGVTGTGKSSFVNKAAGRKAVEIANDLKSKTQKIQHHPNSRRNIVLVDTPGFDDTERSDAEISRNIANWLKETYQNKIKLSGLLYLHRITDHRVAGTPLRNLSVFKDLCGDDGMKNIVLVTTTWTNQLVPRGKKSFSRSSGKL